MSRRIRSSGNDPTRHTLTEIKASRRTGGVLSLPEHANLAEKGSQVGARNMVARDCPLRGPVINQSALLKWEI